MSTVATAFIPENLAELLDRLGDLPPERIRLRPPPGTATEQDLLVRPEGVKRLCELVDGVLVEKPMGFYRSPDQVTQLNEDQILDGEDLLPGFALPIRDWFGQAE